MSDAEESQAERNSSTDKQQHTQDEENVDDRFNAAVELAHSFQMQALFASQEKVPLDLAEGLRLFELLDFTKTNTLTKQEIIDGCTHKIKKHQEVLEFLDKYDNTPFGLLKNKKSIGKVFHRVDKDKDGMIQYNEWKLFLAELIERDLRYLIEKGWASDNCYWATKPPSDPEPSIWFLFKSEWLSDFWYFERNNSPLLGIFMADKNNPLKTLERLDIEFCCQSWALLFTALLALNPSENIGSQYALIFIFVTLPTVVIRVVLLYCFKCPCLIRRHHMSCWRRCCIPCLETAGHIVGLMTFLCAVAVLVVGIMAAARIRHNGAFWTDYVVSIIMSVLYDFGYDMCVPFNPFVFVRRFVEKRPFICCSCRMAGLGDWQLQRKAALDFWRAHYKSTPTAAAAEGLELADINASSAV